MPRVLNIRDCVRCGGDHDAVDFKELMRRAPGWDEWAICPTTGEPIPLSFDGYIRAGNHDVEKPVDPPPKPKALPVAPGVPVTQRRQQMLPPPQEEDRIAPGGNLARLAGMPHELARESSRETIARPTTQRQKIPSIRDLDL